MVWTLSSFSFPKVLNLFSTLSKILVDFSSSLFLILSDIIGLAFATWLIKLSCFALLWLPPSAAETLTLLSLFSRLMTFRSPPICPLIWLAWSTAPANSVFLALFRVCSCAEPFVVSMRFCAIIIFTGAVTFAFSCLDAGRPGHILLRTL